MTKPDIILGAAAAGIGSSGLTVQWLMDVSSLLLMGINLALAIGGLCLLRLRIRIALVERRRQKQEDSDA